MGAFLGTRVVVDIGDAGRGRDHPAQVALASTRRLVEVASGAWAVEGDLTIRGVTRPVVLQVTFEGANAAPTGGERVAFSATTEIDRDDWGMTYNEALEAGGVLIGRQVKIELDIEAGPVLP